MVLQRDSQGLIVNLGVDPVENPLFEDAVLGASRREYFSLVEESSKLDSMIELMNRSNNPVRNLETSLDEQLIYQGHDLDLDNDDSPACPNAKVRPGMWVQVGTFGARAVDPDAPFLNRLAYFCRDAGIRPCSNSRCLENRKEIENLIPHCEWPRFREWAVLLSSCHASFAPEERVTRAYFHLFAAIEACQALLDEYLREGKQHALTGVLTGKENQITIDLFGVCEIIYWLLTTLDRRINPSFEGRWGLDFLPPHITAPAVSKSMEMAQKLGLCPNRFWNLAGVAERKQVDLLGLMETAKSHPQLQHAQHNECTTGFCTFTTLDSTKMEQLHKCRCLLNEVDDDSIHLTTGEAPMFVYSWVYSPVFHVFSAIERFFVENFMDRSFTKPTGDVQSFPNSRNMECGRRGRLWFNPQLLNESILKNGRTIWSISEPFEVLQTGSYVAISHVWSDGTGIGLQTVGEVNRCLFEFFANIIRDLGHSGIWWDTISIPTDREARRKAINDMHKNYSCAAATLLHDKYLVDYEWADDGSPCLALVLSPWLTRGWTALELIMSETVLVLYKGRDGQPVVKNLDTDILAKDPSRCTRAHWIASTIIRRLRKKDINNVSNLLAILKPRTTSWERDRMVIAGLLAGLDDIPSNIRQDEITKKIVNRIYRLNPSSILHGQVTIAETGGWSWCPPSLYNMPVEIAGDLSEGDALGFSSCLVDVNGVLVGSWHYRALEKEEVMLGHIVSSSFEMTVIMKTEDALRRWEYCLLVREHNRSGPGLGFLVIPVGKSSDGEFIHCKFVGSVHDVSPRPPEGYDPRFEYGYFNIGMEGEKEILAKEFCKKDKSVGRPGENFDWLHGKLWMGDSLMGQLLVMRPGSKARITDAFALQVTGKEPRNDANIIPADKMVLYSNPDVILSPEPVFTVKVHRKRGPDEKSREILARLTAGQSWSWPPNTIPAKDRTYYLENRFSPSGQEFSTELFRLPKEKPPVNFAAVDPALFTPDMQSPYKGVWTGSFPFTGYDFLLFHQPNKSRLEVIRLTGGPMGPRGSTFLVVGNLSDEQYVRDKYEWAGLPTVPAQVCLAPQGGDNDKFTSAELTLVSSDEVVVLMEVAVLQFRRISIQELISGEAV